MKKTILFLMIAGLMALVSCKKPKPEQPKPQPTTTDEINVDASSTSEWQYFSLSEKKIVGSAADQGTGNAEWFAKDNWDIAIRRYSIRTNSGEATTIGSKGGVYTFDENIDYETTVALPNGAVFATDVAVTEQGMGGETTSVKSTAQVIKFKTDEGGYLIMPPVYLPTPVYAFRSADGTKVYKVLFTQYKDANGDSGKVKFKMNVIAYEPTEPTEPDPKPSTEANVDASSTSEWQYFSFSENEVVGSAADQGTGNAEWFAKNNWDIAIKRYSIRTNSGEATTIGSQGGVYTFDDNAEYETTVSLPDGAAFATDVAVTEQGMGGEITTVKSTAQVIKFKTNEDGSLIMPPVYLPTPVYAFKSADGTKTYKVLFTQYKDANGNSGKVKFKFVEM